jgi:hypothetical protein
MVAAIAAIFAIGILFLGGLGMLVWNGLSICGVADGISGAVAVVAQLCLWALILGREYK